MITMITTVITISPARTIAACDQASGWRFSDGSGSATAVTVVAERVDLARQR